MDCLDSPQRRFSAGTKSSYRAWGRTCTLLCRFLRADHDFAAWGDLLVADRGPQFLRYGQPKWTTQRYSMGGRGNCAVFAAGTSETRRGCRLDDVGSRAGWIGQLFCEHNGLIEL